METRKRTISAGIPYTVVLRIEAIGLPTFGLLVYSLNPEPISHRAYESKWCVLGTLCSWEMNGSKSPTALNNLSLVEDPP